jgi:hypothetical protein
LICNPKIVDFIKMNYNDLPVEIRHRILRDLPLRARVSLRDLARFSLRPSREDILEALHWRLISGFLYLDTPSTVTGRYATAEIFEGNMSGANSIGQRSVVPRYTVNLETGDIRYTVDLYSTDGVLTSKYTILGREVTTRPTHPAFTITREATPKYHPPELTAMFLYPLPTEAPYYLVMRMGLSMPLYVIKMIVVDENGEDVPGESVAVNGRPASMFIGIVIPSAFRTVYKAAIPHLLNWVQLSLGNMPGGNILNQILAANADILHETLNRM